MSLSLAQIIDQVEDDDLVLFEVIAEKLQADLELVSKIIEKAKQNSPHLKEHEKRLKLFTQLIRSNQLNERQLKNIKKNLVKLCLKLN